MNRMNISLRFTSNTGHGARWTKTLTVVILTCAMCTACSPTGMPEQAQTPSKKALIKFVASEYSTATKPMLENLIRQFEANNPLIHVELQVANWDILDGVYTAMISKNQPPDLLNTNIYAHFAKDGLLLDFNTVLSDQLKSKFYANFMHMDQLEGRQFAIPYFSSIRNLYYNKDLFNNAGLTKPPKTWSELEAAASVIKLSSKAHGFGVDLSDNEIQAYLSYFFFGSGGGWIKNGKWVINSPENVQGLTYLKDLFDRGLTDPEPTVTTRDEKQRILGDGKLGMMISGNYFTSVVPKEFPGLKWGVGPIPVKDGQPPISFGVQDVLVAFKTDHTDKEAIARFLDFLYDDANYEQMTLREGFLPVTKPVGDKLSSDSVIKDNLDNLRNAKFYPIDNPVWSAVMDASRTMGQAVLYDHLSPKAALDQLQQFAETRSSQK
jgi:multiple sugar transport system substrate-binding protein